MPKDLLELHSTAANNVLTRKLAEVHHDWATINNQVIVIIESTEAQRAKTGFQLDKVSVAI